MFFRQVLSLRLSYHTRQLAAKFPYRQISPISSRHIPSLCWYLQKFNYVDVKMKWKKDVAFDSIQIIDRSEELRSLISLKNSIRNEGGSIPISLVSKRGYDFAVSGRISTFLRQYPAIFEEFMGEKYKLPWFRLTQEAIDLDKEEQSVFDSCRPKIVERLKKLVMMTKENRLPLKIIQGMQWYLGLPDEFLDDTEVLTSYGSFELVELEGELFLSLKHKEMMLSAVQKSALARGEDYEQGSLLAFNLVPSKGLRLKRKIEEWLDQFQKLPYISPYEDSLHLRPDSDIAEKRVIGVLHELLSFFVDNSSQRRKLLCLRKHLGLPQKFVKAFERHPSIFYLSLKNKTCTAILKEAHVNGSMIEKHPILDVRKKYLRLMDKSKTVIISRRHRNQIPPLQFETQDNSYGEIKE